MDPYIRDWTGQPYTDHGEEGDGPRSMVVDGNEVDEESKATNQGREERGTKQHLLDPFLAYMRCMWGQLL